MGFILHFLRVDVVDAMLEDRIPLMLMYICGVAHRENKVVQ